MAFSAVWLSVTVRYYLQGRDVLIGLLHPLCESLSRFLCDSQTFRQRSALQGNAKHTSLNC